MEEKDQLEESLQDITIHTENHRQLMFTLGQHEGKMGTLFELVVSQQTAIAGIIDMLSRSHLKRDRGIKNELKSMKALANVLDANAKKIVEMLDSESILKFSMVRMARGMKDDKQENGEEEKDESAYV